MKIKFVIAEITLICILVVGCNGEGSNQSVYASQDWSRDILSTSLMIDLSSMTAVADIVLAGSVDSTGASFEVGDLTISSVAIGGNSLDYRVEGNRLDVGIPISTSPVELVISYSFNIHHDYNGILDSGLTVTWPYFCGNVYPCKSDPSDGQLYNLFLLGVPDGMEAVYPSSIPADSPSYMMAWAIGDYNYTDLGTTTNGTQVGVYYTQNDEASAIQGTRMLRDVMDWYEQTYGEYIFGNEVASVSADWGAGQYGGLEHHPFWHISRLSMSDQTIHAHEAAHGWFGNGVRIACWEDFVLSEGVASYLAARSLTEVGGEVLGDTIWSTYSSQLNRLQNSDENKIAWPDSCNQVDILNDGLFGAAPYMKGAFFLRHVESVVGKSMLDQALRSFYQANKEGYAGMQDLLDMILTQTGYDPAVCANAWLRSETIPTNGLCGY